ncbi:hypothetical protein GETHLI_05600 [Geothrix limicola]|uniref:Uncharacterized protein n=1 Tax=Geothrix limicola TaxID=2927978 RepID=A0ABQ5QCB3_9BACT|nr:hypothetical protein [Geothrix limicola]GLH72058.1 hypothetical protein GETHLI_05600 [Geothrix limicola]
MSTNGNVIPTFDELKVRKPNLTPSEYGLKIFMTETEKEPSYKKFELKMKRRMAQPAIKLSGLKRECDGVIHDVAMLTMHPSPLVRAKAKREAQIAIDTLTALLKLRS